jgi:hypothetical protein
MGKVLHLLVTGETRLVSVPIDLAKWQALVDGYIEVVHQWSAAHAHLQDDYMILVNEDGQFWNMQVNANASALTNVQLVGSVIVTLKVQFD